MNTLFRVPTRSRPRRRGRGVDHGGPLARLWAAFVISMLLASMIPALANPVLAAPKDDSEPAAAAETQQPLQPLGGDSDGDGVADDSDNCPDVANPDQTDSDGNGVGDACEQVQPPADTDQDGVADNVDNCPTVGNPDQADADGNGVGDACDQPTDTDQDGIVDSQDNCPDNPNPDQADTDGNGVGDACEQMQIQGETNGSVEARLLICPAGTTSFPADETTCNLYDSTKPGTFSLNTVQQQTDTGGVTLFTDVAPGNVTLALVSPPLNTPLSVGFNPFCTTDQPEPGQSNTKPYANADSSSISFDLKSGENVHCDWYAIFQGVDIYHTKYVCPYGYDWSGKSHDDLKADCTRPVAETTFTVQSTGYDQTIAADPNQGNTAAFMGVPGGNLTMYENLPPEYEFLTVYCTVPNPGVTGQASYQEQRRDEFNQLVVQMDSGEIRCDWFNRELPSAIVILKVNCPEGWTPSEPGMMSGIRQDCTPPDPAVTFDVRWNAPTVQGDQSLPALQTGSDGIARSTEIAPGGQAFISEQVPDGYKLTYIFCREVSLRAIERESQPNIRAVEGTDIAPQYENLTPQDDSATVERNLRPGHIIVCVFIDTPTQQGGQVILVKLNCPEGWTAPEGGPTLTDLQNCQLPDSPVTFDVQQGGQTQSATTVTGESLARTEPMDLPDGEVMITEQVPDGYELAYIFCRFVERGPVVLTEQPMTNVLQVQDNGPGFESQGITDNGMTSTIRGGYVLVCVFIDIPVQTYEVTLYKWQCDPGTMSDQPLEYYQGGLPDQDTGPCETSQAPGVPFTLTDANGDTPFTSGDHTGVTLPVVPDASGNFTITEGDVEGYGIPFRYCLPLNQPEDGGAPPAWQTGGMGKDITVTVVPGEYSYQCWFYNIPTGGYGDIHIYKWSCPDGVTPPMDAGYDWYHENCTTPMNGVEFTVDQPDPEVDLKAMTNDSGQEGYISFGGVPIGTYPVTETPQDGYELGAVFCYTAPAPNSIANPPYESFTPSDGSSTIQVVLENGYVVTCHWFNVPMQDYSVTVYKYVCDEGTLPGQTLDYYAPTNGDPGPCETQQADVPFTLTHGGPDVPFVSEIDGHQESFIPDAAGGFTITEGELDGYGMPFRYCLPLNLPEDGGAPPAWQTGGMGKDITVTVVPGEYQYQCWFYNIPETPSSITVYKWQCPEGTLYGQEGSYYSAECATQMPDVPFTLTDSVGTTPFVSEIDGVQLDNVMVNPGDQFVIAEDIPDGYGLPVVFCQNNGEDPQPDAPTLVTSPGGVISVMPSTHPFEYQCFWYNIPWQDSTVTIRKWECPEGATPDGTPEWYQTNCTTPMNGVDFTLTDSMGPRMQTTAGGQVQWTDVQTGAVSIAETIPPGYNPDPYVVCGWTAMVNGAVVDAFPQPVATINGVWNTTITYPGTDVFCDWYNQYLGPGEITVYKYECPEGYDPYAWGANPLVDCDTALNGVTFVLDQPDPEVNLQSNTGDSINGAVYFGGLAPGDYTISEMVPDGYESVFVWDCVGIHTSSVHPKPLSVGPNLDFPIAGGDSIECYWYNIPMPQNGWMLVKKFDCTTQTYVTDVNCYTNTTGQAFDLQMWNGSNWMTVQSGTTNATGQVTFMNLDPGDYRLVEPGKTACLMKSSNITSGGNIGVAVNQQTTVYVYNCSTPQKPPPTTPGKYPNTGVEPGASGPELRTPFGASILGMLGLAGASAVSRRTFLKRAAVGTLAVGSGTVALNEALASQTLVPIDATVTPVGSPEATPSVDCMYPATPSATPEGVMPGTPVACARGAVPVHIRIPSIGVDFPIEYLEIIEGEMQQPTGADYITWYKETARLGEKGNGLYAGHLNWWGIPEGPFFLLDTLVEGDVVELDGDDGETYRYIVQWEQAFPIDEDPPAEALGPSEDEVITMVTCGGQWDASVALYDHRTTVRAIRDRDFVPGTPAPGA